MILLTGGAVFTCGVLLRAEWLSEVIFKSPANAHLLRLAAFGFFAAVGRNVTNYFLWASARFDRISIIQSVSAVSRAVLASTLVITMGLPGLVIGLAATDVIAFLMSLWFLRDLLVGPRVTLHPFGPLIRESLPFYLEAFLIYFRSQGDNWIVATMLGPAAMSVFFVAKRLPQMLLMFLESLDKIITSEVSRRQTDDAEVERYIRRTFILNGYVVLPGVMLIASTVPAFIVLVAGRAYTAAILPCLILCAAQLVQVMNLPLARGIFVTSPPLTRVRLTVVESIALVAGLVVFAPPLAENGVALSRVVAGAAAMTAAFLVVKRTLGIGLPWHKVGLSLVAAAPMAALVLGLQTWRPEIYFVPLYALAGVLVFLLIVSATNSEAFYGTLNSILPFRVADPLRFLKRRPGAAE